MKWVITLTIALGCGVEPEGIDDASFPEEGDDAALMFGSTEDPHPNPDSCNGRALEYCYCRVFHPCWSDPAQCDPLTDCLNAADAQYTYCTDYPPGPSYPESITECFPLR